jgi:iron complex transport system ATP-binding protein
VFVVAGSGTGVPVYRELQKRDIPFATGILFENDADFQVACGLSDHVVSAPAFRPMGEEQFREAAALMRRCGKVIDAGAPEGELNEMNRRLLELAREEGLPVTGPEGNG